MEPESIQTRPNIIGNYLATTVVWGDEIHYNYRYWRGRHSESILTAATQQALILAATQYGAISTCHTAQAPYMAATINS